jgi:predicted amidophosphoribosyltransferase
VEEVQQRSYCPVCGQQADPDAAGRPLACPNRWCRSTDRSFSVVFSIGVHQGGLRRAIARYKYRGEERLAPIFSGMVRSYLVGHPAWFEEFDLITAVPAYTGPGARRAWDPVGTILGHLAAAVPAGWAIEPGVLTKRAETPRMTGLSWADRQEIARNPFRRSLVVARPERVRGAQVLVLDDVFTEGSTLREVARALRRSGASDVAGLVLARPAWAPAPG